MVLLSNGVESKKLDVRMVERNVARGVVSAKDVEEAMKRLPDDSANADYVSIQSLIEEPNGSAE